MLTDDASLAQRIEAIAHPGLTANFDVAKSAALAVTLADWQACGAEYAQAMVAAAAALAEALERRGVPVFAGGTASHQLAVLAARFGGGTTAARRLRRANLLASGIGLPVDPVAGDVNGLRLGTPEVVRVGMTASEMPSVAGFTARALAPDADLASLAQEVTDFRSGFAGVHFVSG